MSKRQRKRIARRSTLKIRSQKKLVKYATKRVLKVMDDTRPIPKLPKGRMKSNHRRKRG